MPENPSAPSDLGPSGAALYAELTAAYEFEPHEIAVVLEAARVRDRLDLLDADVRRDGTTVASPQGVKTHPSLVEARAQAIALARLVTSLRLPDESDARPQRRGTRGVYSIASGPGARVAKPGPRVARG
jgi:hypothetical protein